MATTLVKCSIKNFYNYQMRLSRTSYQNHQPWWLRTQISLRRSRKTRPNRIPRPFLNIISIRPSWKKNRWNRPKRIQCYLSTIIKMVGESGFEPPTSCSQDRCSLALTYWILKIFVQAKLAIQTIFKLYFPDLGVNLIISPAVGSKLGRRLIACRR